MNTKVTFPELVDAVSNATNTPKRLSEIFLKELFSLVGERLVAGENVKIKNLGTFKLILVEARKSVNVNTGEEIEIPSHNKISFVPDKDLAEAINQPFSGFETVILSDGIPDEELDRLASTGEIVMPSETLENIAGVTDSVTDKTMTGNTNESVYPNIESPENSIGGAVDDDAANIEKAYVTDIPEDTDNYREDNVKGREDAPVQPGEEIKGKLPDESENEIPIDAWPVISEPDTEPEEPVDLRNSFKRGFLWGFFIALVVSLGTFIGVSIVVGFPLSYHGSDLIQEKTDTIKNESTVIEHTLVPDETKRDSTYNINKPVIKVRRDTVSRTRFLTTMAREYYGNYNFWVYIYEENRNIIDNPDLIKPGTIIIIPPPDKYGINKDDPQSLEAAKQKAFEIFKKYE